MIHHALLDLEEVTIGYRPPRRPAHVVARDITVSLCAGEFVCLLGPNGAGKSTLIRTITGMQPPLAGEALLEGTPVTAYAARELAQRMSLVLTQRVAVGMMPVVTLVAMGRHPYTDWTGKLSAGDEAAVHRAIADVGIEHLAHRPVCELSDGERQKVMIARALAQEPRVMILDEATAFLDLPRRVELMHLLRGLARTSGRAILLSTHDLDLALRCADRLWLLPPGGAFQQGVPEDLVLSDAFAATFADAGVQFDKGSGAFALERRHRGSIALVGDGIPVMWTYRALERAGYVIVPPGTAQICVEVYEHDNQTRWRIHEEPASYTTVESLLDRLICHQCAMEETRA